MNFTKRNFKEMLRDPIIYIFCLGFPLVMLVLFQVINSYTNGFTPMFELKALVPGIMMFSYTFVMLLMSLLVSKDKETSFLKRLFTSPMKSHEFILGYVVPGFIIGLVQSLITVFAGYIISLINSVRYISLGQMMLLIISEIPMLLISIFLGVLFGVVLNDKSAPGICSIFISAAGVLGGCWMPIETMGGFEKICRFLPFYPSVYLGRIITDAKDTLGNAYEFSFELLISIIVFLVTSVLLSIACFKYKSENN
jgi:ABC-2 type transport system permease protein